MVRDESDHDVAFFVPKFQLFPFSSHLGQSVARAPTAMRSIAGTVRRYPPHVARVGPRRLKKDSAVVQPNILGWPRFPLTLNDGVTRRWKSRCDGGEGLADADTTKAI